VIIIRSDLLKKLFQSYAESDRDQFIEIAHEVIKEKKRITIY